MKTLFTFLLGLLWLSSAAQTGIAVPQLAHCDESMQQFMRRWNVLGASVALTKDGKLVYDRAFGYADVARTVPLQPYHLLRVASVSKSVTALAIMKLVEEKKISLTHKVFGPKGYLNGPAYTREIQDPRLNDITVQHLLEHTAGWDRTVSCDGQAGCDPIDFPTRVAAAMGVANPVGDSTLVRYLLRQGLNYAPGTRFAYSNVGYLMLGKVLEAVTHQHYETWVRQHILQPSGVLEAHLGHNLLMARQERESDYQSTYRMLSCYNTGEQVPAAYGGFQIEAMSAHGGWLFSARDLVRLALAADGSPTRPDIVSAATLRSMTQPSALAPGYAKGLMVNGETWWHTGLLDGTASLVARTASGYTWSILLNTSSGSVEFWRELQGLGWAWVADATTWPAHDLFAPEQNAAHLRASALDSARTRLTWLKGNGTHRLVLLRADGPSTAFPADGVAYPVGSTLPDGSRVAANGTASTALLAHLSPQRAYYARVVEYRQGPATANQPVYTVEGNPTVALHAECSAQPSVQLAFSTSDELRAAAATDSMPYRVPTAHSTLARATSLMPERRIPVRKLPQEVYFMRNHLTWRQSVAHFVRL